MCQHQLSARNRRSNKKCPRFDAVGNDGVDASPQFIDAVDRNCGRARAVDPRANRIEKNR